MFARYLEALSKENRLDRDGPVRWYFYTGMLFSSPDKWWDDFKFRASTHEGIDITYYSSGGTAEPSRISQFDPATRVPAIEDGRIIHICDDFLGHTLVVEGPDSTAAMRQIITYAHIVPADGIETRSKIQKNQVLATVCDTVRNPALPPHLHLSCFEVPRSVPADLLNWTLFSKPGNFRMINPVWL